MTDRAGGQKRGAIVTANIPGELRERRQWVLWRYEERDGKPTKIPYNALTGRWASATNPSTWTRFDKAMAALDTGSKYDGIGYVFSDADPFCGIDLDDCIGENGAIEPWAQRIIDSLSTYTEISPSGRGVKLFLQGKLPEGGNRKDQIEIYDRARYFTVTSHHLPSTPSTIENRQPELANLHAELFGQARPLHGATYKRPTTLDADDAAILKRARSAKNQEKFVALFDVGDLSAYGGDDSAADLALCSLLACHAQDPERIDHLFRHSALIRPKWDSKRGDSTYGAKTIAKALEGVVMFDRAGDRIRAPGEIIADLLTLKEKPDLEKLQRLVRQLSDALSGSDRLEVALQREAAIKALQGKVTAPARILDAALAEVQSQRSDETAQGSAMAFSEPEPWPEPVDGGELLDGLSATFERYVVLQPGTATVLSLWVIHTFASEAAWITPRLAITSPVMRCAKTLVLIVLEQLVSKALMASNVSAAAVFRCIDKFQPSLLVDEADTFLAGKDELRGVLNSGHRRGGMVLRVSGDDLEPRAFRTFAPVAIALIGKLRTTLADRSIEIEMRRKKPDEKVESLRLDRLGHFEELRRCCARWAQDHLEELREADPEVPPELHDRAADNWRPLLAIADAVGGSWPERARRVAATLSGTEASEDGSAGTMLLADIRDTFSARETDVMESKAMLTALLAREDRPWGEWRRGQPLTAIGVAKLLKNFSIKPRKIRIGTETIRGYRLEWFRDAFSRYLPPESEHPEQSAPEAGLRDSSTRNTTEGVPTCEAAENPDGTSIVPGVPTWESGTAAEEDESWGDF